MPSQKFKLRPKYGPPAQKSIDDEPLLRTLQGRMGDKRGTLVPGETVSDELEDATPMGNEAFVTDHINSIKQKLPDDLCKPEHFPTNLRKGKPGCKLLGGSCVALFPVDSCMS